MKQILLVALFPLAAVATFFGANAFTPTQQLGAPLPQAVAVFETSLAAPITSSATTMTLTANAIRGGGALSGYNCFTVDEGSAQAETICGSVSGTTVSGIQRGVSQSTGTTTVATLQFSHRRGANVKITDFPTIQILKAQANGEDTFPNLLTYTSGTACGVSSSSSAICDKAYMDGLAVSGASNASTVVKGIVELATSAESAAATASGGTGALLVPANSLFNATPSATVIGVVTNAAGKIAQGFLDLTQTFSWTALQTFSAGYLATASSTNSATTTIAASSVTNRALILNGVPYSFPSGGIASSTVWGFDANGKASFVSIASTTSGVLSIAANSGANTVALGFKARLIRMSWSYPLSTNGVVQILSGSGLYNVQTNTYSEQYGANTASSSGAPTVTANTSTSKIVSGESSSTDGTFDGTIGSVTTTGFTLTMTNATGATPTVKIQYEVEI